MNNCLTLSARLWREGSDDGGSWSLVDDQSEHTHVARKPIPTYSKRSQRLADLRAHVGWANARDNDDCSPPSGESIAAAENFINGLADGVLSYDCRLAISHDGEINFFFESGAELFQVLIHESGKLSYHAQNPQSEVVDSEIDPADFPHLELLKFLSRHH